MASKIVKVGDKEFRYDYKDCVVEYVMKADAQMYEDNKEWQKKWGRDLWDIDAEGYEVIASAGLSREHWDDKEARKEYLEMWAQELDEESQYLAEQYMMYG